MPNLHSPDLFYYVAQRGGISGHPFQKANLRTGSAKNLFEHAHSAGMSAVAAGHGLFREIITARFYREGKWLGPVLALYHS